MSSPAALLERRPVAVAVSAAVLVAVLAAPFGTGFLEAPARALFWAAAIGWNAVKWWAWYGLVAPRAGPGWRPQLAVAAAGALLLNLPLPFEIGLLYRALGRDTGVLPFAEIYASAVAVSLAISALLAVARPQPAAAPAVAVPAAAAGLAARAGVADLQGLRSVTAEDHYLRLAFADGRRPLVLYRFGDALLELAGSDGEQVHRSAWVAASAVTGAVRDGRRWRLTLADGTEVPVSDRFAGVARARGWLVAGPVRT